MRAQPALIAVCALTACGASSGSSTHPSSPQLAHWTSFVHIHRPVDVVGPRSDRAMVVAAAGRLWLLRPSGHVDAYPGSYRSPGGGEPYIALSPGGCFGADTIYALRLVSGPGVTAIGRNGHTRLLAGIAAPGLLDGIAFDGTGRYGHRLLVTVTKKAKTTVEAIDCHGSLTTITRNAPRLEGGIAVAPSSFGRFGGELIAPDELGGGIYAITPSGKSLLVAQSGLPHGQDVGVESEVFVPGGAHRDALFADRLTPGNHHPGDDQILRIRRAALGTAGVGKGDLLVGAEGGALTDVVSCTITACQVRLVANGPAVAHGEGHLGFTASNQ